MYNITAVGSGLSMKPPRGKNHGFVSTEDTPKLNGL